MQLTGLLQYWLKSDFDHLTHLTRYHIDGDKTKTFVKMLNVSTLQIQNAVGVMTLPTGLLIEVLPKVQIAPRGKEKAALLKMLLSVNGTRCGDGSLHEVIIRAFLDEVALLVRYGPKSHYKTTQANLGVIKGKILFTQDLKRNHTLRHRTFVQYEQRHIDILPNRLIGEALGLCRRISKLHQNDARRLAHYFDGTSSVDYQGGLLDRWLEAWEYDRYFKHYNTIKPLVRMVLLGGHCFSIGPYHYKAWLVDIAVVFECYVAQQLKAVFGEALVAQDTRYLDEQEQFKLKPDLWLRLGDKSLVADTKWKRYGKDFQGQNKGIQEADRYQMWAYASRYKCDVILIYPKAHGHHQAAFQATFAPMLCDLKVPLNLKVYLWDLHNDASEVIQEDFVKCGRPCTL